MKLQDLMKLLELVPLPGEGGYYRETYRSSEIYSGNNADRASSRNICTAIYYALGPKDRSLLHRLPTDEVFHHYAGDSVRMLQLHPNGDVAIVRLGRNFSAGDRPQIVVPAGVYQGCHIVEKIEGWALMGTTMSPSFEFEQFELGGRRELLERYPEDCHSDIVLLTNE